jgi:tellurite resistance protein TehA-like permease
MATGIVSIAAAGGGLRSVGVGIFVLNVAIYLLLGVLSVLRLIRYPDAVASDYRKHAIAPGFFTLVAATCIVGNQITLFVFNGAVAFGLWIFGLLAWFLLTYSMLSGLMEAEVKPTLESGINGAWLLAVVGTQGVSVLGSRVAHLAPSGAIGPDVFIALTFWLIGGMLYLWLIALIFYRCLFLPLTPQELSPPYWINMGAMAISTLAGLLLVENARGLAALGELLPFLEGTALLYWATATWWIPMLLALGAWRHIRKRAPFVYDHSNWAAVFPLGMYTVCTQYLVRVLHLSFLSWVPELFVWIALVAWGVTFAALCWHLVSLTFRSRA